LNFDNDNDHFQLALQFVTHTSQHIFLTGKAGTGKTTFLRFIKEHCSKKMAIAAPTGVAAINAGGVTLHSLFQLPFGSFIPVQKPTWRNSYSGAFNDKNTLLKNSRLGRDRRKLIYELELLIIDEVSMVRADLLDAVDTILRVYRKKEAVPFGGVQVLFIGDLYQLPPVINSEEWMILNEYYRSPFFFDAQVLKQSPPIYLELRKIYRQKDELFINLLNKIRHNDCTKADIDFLHNYYRPGFQPGKDQNLITLTTHNSKADIINQNGLQLLPGRQYVCDAEIKGAFQERSYPVESRLLLKEGAQIMFVKNDKGETRRYFNGKIATIKKIEAGVITVFFAAEQIEFVLEKETWSNIRYEYNNHTDEIEEQELGSFTQYPIRLAWAITIHKSQGLTFDKAIIDAGASFAAGQLYVALSRLRSLDGLILYSRISKEAIQTDERVVAFADTQEDDKTITQILQQSQKQFVTQTLLHAFDLQKLIDEFHQNHTAYEERHFPGKEQALQWSDSMLTLFAGQQEIANKFITQLERLLPSAESNKYQQLEERITAATKYFQQSLGENVRSLKKHIDESKVKAKTKRYTHALTELQVQLARKIQQIKNAAQIAGALAAGKPSKDLLTAFLNKSQSRQEPESSATKKQKAQKGDSHRISLQFFREGKTIAAIAQQRSMAQSTIEGHLATFVTTGEIKIEALVATNKITAIVAVLQQNDTRNSTAIRNMLGNDYSHGEIRAVMCHLDYIKETRKENV